jgi:hypothetical protein
VLVCLLKPNEQMHYGDGEARRCRHGPNDGSPAHETPVGRKFESIRAPGTPGVGWRGTTSPGPKMQSTVGARATSGRAQRNVTKTRSPPLRVCLAAGSNPGARGERTIAPL